MTWAVIRFLYNFKVTSAYLQSLYQKAYAEAPLIELLVSMSARQMGLKLCGGLRRMKNSYA